MMTTAKVSKQWQSSAMRRATCEHTTNVYLLQDIVRGTNFAVKLLALTACAHLTHAGQVRHVDPIPVPGYFIRRGNCFFSMAARDQRFRPVSNRRRRRAVWKGTGVFLVKQVFIRGRPSNLVFEWVRYVAHNFTLSSFQRLY